ncbi:MAG: hypothetical protein ACOYBV_05015 [Candidatus Avilachnospira sp.]
MDKQKKFNSLEDIEKKLVQSRKEGTSKKIGKAKKQTAMYVESPVRDFLRDYSRLLVIPAVSVVLIIFIMVAEAVTGNTETEDPSAATVSVAATEPENEPEPLEEPGLRSGYDTDVGRLINDYFYARLNADVDTLYTVFNRSSETGRDELQKRLDAERSWIQSYDGIKVYLLPGLEEGDELAVITYKINFRRTDTMAPGIMYCYISHREDGSPYIEENLLKDKLDYINEQLEEPEVKELIESTDRELKAALSSDSDLALIYTSFNNGEIYKEQDLDVNREQEVDIMFTPEGSDLTGGQGSDLVIDIDEGSEAESPETMQQEE